MKLRTEIDFDPVTPFLHIPGDPKECCIDDVCKDAMAAHALMLAMSEWWMKSDEEGIDEYQSPRGAVEWVQERADELMREWGFE